MGAVVAVFIIVCYFALIALLVIGYLWALKLTPRVMGWACALINRWADRAEAKALGRDIPSPSAPGRADAPGGPRIIGASTYIVRGKSLTERLNKKASLEEINTLLTEAERAYF
jgi:hypothetical protein